MILSDETPAPVAEETTGGVDGAGLEAQLKEAAADRDRHIADKSKLVAKASALAKELDAARAELASATSERDGLRGELAAVSGQRDSLRSERDAAAAQRETALAERDRLAAEAAAATREIQRLNERLAALPKPDPAVVFADLAAEKTKALVAWTRSKIPADSPHLAKFDRTVETLTKGGCIAVKTTRDVYRWSAPRAVEAYAWAKPRALELLAKAKTALDDKTEKKG
ncbi:hypothetical protein [Methylosinus sp. Sm6]|uniref:hypothetical protein n=1 Tax=Methylosinus sp. Sm6 TaxID=2866948 RepID=UPI001C999AE6|nr:hypothetical protein [Methylosinus sp. Sm6]MBY6239710.1 hypothetical protein [Methylosinus sp. Sm6]